MVSSMGARLLAAKQKIESRARLSGKPLMDVSRCLLARRYSMPLLSSSSMRENFEDNPIAEP